MDRILDAIIRLAARHPRVRPAAARLHYAMGANRPRVAQGNFVASNEAFLRRTFFDVAGTGNHIDIGPGARVQDVKFFVRGTGHRISIGPECLIKAGTLWCESQGCRLVVGAETTIEEAHLAVAEPGVSVTIGRDCMLAFDVDIRGSDAHSILDRSTGICLNPGKDVVIGDHVWLAAHTQVLKGVHIGSGSVVGIRSVVTHDVPAHCVVCGVPARVVRENIDWDRKAQSGGGKREAGSERRRGAGGSMLPNPGRRSL